jgi:predicted heme/steroid binding protein
MSRFFEYDAPSLIDGTEKVVIYQNGATKSATISSIVSPNTLVGLSDTVIAYKQWLDVTDSASFWPDIVFGSWTGSAYRTDLGDLKLRNLALPWAAGFRPTHFRVHFEVDVPTTTVSLVIKDTANHAMFNTDIYNAVSGQVYELNTSYYLDIFEFYAYGSAGTDLTVTKIEFLYGAEVSDGQYFGEVHWLDTSMVFNGTAYDVTGTDPYITVRTIGDELTNWATGYRPPKVKVTFTTAQPSVSLVLTTDNEGTILNQANAVSGQEYLLDWSSGDNLYYIDFLGLVATDSVEAIEFIGPSTADVEQYGLISFDYGTGLWRGTTDGIKKLKIDSDAMVYEPQLSIRGSLEQSVPVIRMKEPFTISEGVIGVDDVVWEIDNRGRQTITNRSSWGPTLTINDYNPNGNTVFEINRREPAALTGDFITFIQYTTPSSAVEKFKVTSEGIVRANGYRYMSAVTVNLGTVTGSFSVDMDLQNERYFKVQTGVSGTITILNPPQDAMALVLDVTTTADVTLTITNSLPVTVDLLSGKKYRLIITMYDDGSYPSYWVKSAEIGV